MTTCYSSLSGITVFSFFKYTHPQGGFTPMTLWSGVACSTAWASQAPQRNNIFNTWYNWMLPQLGGYLLSVCLVPWLVKYLQGCLEEGLKQQSSKKGCWYFLSIFFCLVLSFVLWFYFCSYFFPLVIWNIYIQTPDGQY